MNKNEFLKKLDGYLSKLPVTERQEIVQDFEEHFTIGLENGKSEEEIAGSLGSPQTIAKETLAMYHLEKIDNDASFGNVFRAVWAAIGLGFFNLVILLGPFIALLAIVFSGWAISAAFIASPILFLINSIMFPGAFALFDLFITITLCGLGLLIAIGMFFATRTLTSAFGKYLKFNVKLVKGGLPND